MAKSFTIIHIENLRKIFLSSVESVRPVNLFNKYSLKPKIPNDRRVILKILGKTIDITRKRCYIVGFGKAVLGMAVQLEKSLEKRLVSGIISIPVGTLKQFSNDDDMKLSSESTIKVYEGAPNNQPDEIAVEAAKNIKDLASRMGENDILFVLISGGGSALLPMPKVPITLQQKLNLIKSLSMKGASIDEMNIVRIALSDIKGGRLAAAAKNAYAVISFVISDIVNDPVDLIASGPTCPIRPKKISPLNILEKYKLWLDLDQNIQDILLKQEDADVPGGNNSIHIVGDNKVATTACFTEADTFGYVPFILSTSIQGSLLEVLNTYKNLLESLKKFQTNKIEENEFLEVFPFDCRLFKHFITAVKMSEQHGKPLLLILAGEPTVNVNGTGIGGRNQELAMHMALECFTNPLFKDICFLSAGTDGIDGPCPAAGAIGCKMVLEEFLKQNDISAFRKYLKENDSYSFYRKLCDGSFHIVTGHTGTNVMDLHLILVP